jgi:starch-binding outer membrane protein, SusD/RagB family
MHMRSGSKGIPGVRGLKAGAMALVLLGTTGCLVDGILDARLPGRVAESELDNPDLAVVMTTGVVADLECAWSTYSSAAAFLSDETIGSSTGLFFGNWSLRDITADNAELLTGCEGAHGTFVPLQSARFQSDEAFRRLSGFSDTRVPNRPTLMATVRAYGAYALVALGEAFCEVTLSGGPLLTPAAVLTLAEQRFTEALTLATQANNNDLRWMALNGRARVRLNLRNYAGARTDAALVPAGWVRNATRDESDVRRYNKTFENLNGTVASRRNASVAPAYRNLTWQGVADPRVVAVSNGVASADGVTIHFGTTKFTSRSAPMPIASGREARLIVAEAAARTGDLATARQIINDLHSAAGIPGYDPGGTATQDQVIAQVIEERRRELFLEGGHRLNDIIRLQGTAWSIPLKGQPGSVHPDGRDHKNRPYGNTVCLPLPSNERIRNPNL